MAVSFVSANLTRLLTMVFLPLGLFATAVLYWNARLEQTQADNHLSDTAQSLALAVDRQLAVSVAALAALAEAAARHESNPAGFHELAARVGEHYGGWVVMVDATAQQVVNTRLPRGAPLPRSADVEVIAAVFATGRPVVSDLFVGSVARRPIISVNVPVFRDGRVVYALDMVVPPELLARLLQAHPIPEGWNAGIVDSKGAIVAWTHPGAPAVGSAASPWLVEAMRSRPRGIVEGAAAAGQAQRVSFARLPEAPLTIALAAPVSAMVAWKRGPLAVFVLGGTVLFIALVTLAVRHADRLSRSLSSMILVGDAFAAGRAGDRRRGRLRRALEGYAIAVASVAMAIVVRLLLDPVLGDRFQLTALFAAIAVTVWYGGWGPGLFATVAGYAITDYLLMEPRGAFGMKGETQLAGLALYVASSMVMLALGARARRSELAESRRAAQAEGGHALLRTLLDHAPIGITVAGGPPDFPIIVNSRTAVALAGRSAEELVGMPVGAHEKAFGFHLPDGVQQLPPQATPLYRACHGETVLDQEGVVVRPDGSRIVVSMAAVPIRDTSGNVVGAIKCWYDISERKAAEVVLREADARKDTFLATLAHELRNPLAAIRNALALLGAPDVPDATARRGQAIAARQVMQLTRLVDDLLDVSRITMGKIQLARAPVRLDEVVNEAVEACRPDLERARHELAVVLPEDPVWVNADRARLVQIVTNILVNSTKYTPPGGHIAVACTADAAQATLYVRDDGMGISAEFLPRVFEPFQQGEAATGEIKGGLGIGLTLVRQLVEMQGGTVEASSSGLGQGSTFTVRLPRIDAPDAALVRESELTPATGGASAERAARRRVLVVDDNVDAAESTSILLRLEGHAVRSALDGEQALAAIREFRPEVMVVDLGMPGLSGFDVARRARQMPESEGVLLIALTGWGHDAHRGRTADAGFDHHLVKPVDPRLLNELVCSAPGSGSDTAGPIRAQGG